MTLYRSEGIKKLYENRKALKCLVNEQALSLDASIAFTSKLAEAHEQLSKMNKDK
jgi:hypothetical protein